MHKCCALMFPTCAFQNRQPALSMTSCWLWISFQNGGPRESEATGSILDAKRISYQPVMMRNTNTKMAAMNAQVALLCYHSRTVGPTRESCRHEDNTGACSERSRLRPSLLSLCSVPTPWQTCSKSAQLRVRSTRAAWRGGGGQNSTD